MTDYNWTFRYFHYSPSLAAAVLFIVFFSVPTGIHGYQMLRQRAWLMSPFLLGGCCRSSLQSRQMELTEVVEVVGYVARAIASQQTPNWTLGSFAVNTIFVLIAPALFAASIYMLLGRIILLIEGERYSVVRRAWLTKIFVGGDMLSFVTQSLGMAPFAKYHHRY